MDLSLPGRLCSVMKGKFNRVEKVHSLMLLAFTNFIVLEVENYLSLTCVRNMLGLEEKEWINFPSESRKILIIIKIFLL